MRNEKICVALIYGGRGCESDVSILGMEHIMPILKERFDLLPVFIDRDGRWHCNGRVVYPASGGFIADGGERIAVDCALPLLHGDFGEDGCVQGALECASVPYVGCDVMASAICRDKSVVKTIAAALGIPTLPHILIDKRAENSAENKTETLVEKTTENSAENKAETLADDKNETLVKRIAEKCQAAVEQFGFPLFVKPTRLGSSIGAMAAEDKQCLLSAVSDALKLCDRVMIEPCLIAKRELECGYFLAKGKEIFTNPGEIIIDGQYGYERKYIRDMPHLKVCAEVEEKISQKIREYSQMLVAGLGVRDLSRIDYFLSGDELYFNEINTMPGFTDGSLYAKMIERAGISEAVLLFLLIEQARDR